MNINNNNINNNDNDNDNDNNDAPKNGSTSSFFSIRSGPGGDLWGGSGVPSGGRPGGPEGRSKMGPLCGTFEGPDGQKCLFFAVVGGGQRDPPPKTT